MSRIICIPTLTTVIYFYLYTNPFSVCRNLDIGLLRVVCAAKRWYGGRDCAPDDYSGRDNDVITLWEGNFPGICCRPFWRVMSYCWFNAPASILAPGCSQQSLISVSTRAPCPQHRGLYIFFVQLLPIVQCDLRNFEAHVFAVSELLRSKWVQRGVKLFIISTFIFRVLTMVNWHFV